MSVSQRLHGQPYGTTRITGATRRRCTPGTRDGTDTPAIDRPSQYTMYMLYTNTQGNADEQFAWGRPSCIPATGDLGAVSFAAALERSDTPRLPPRCAAQND
jgi:hypothetical protein